jgi:tRNA (guanine-N7-)-methyltransferase
MQQLWAEIFGNDAAVEVEIGPGTGTFMLAAATARSHINFFGIERSRARAARLETAINARLLTNARVVAADAACIVATIIPPLSVGAYHIYFPDPWWKRRHHRRRLFTPHFAAALARTLVPGGHLHVATDVDDTFAQIVETVGGCGLLGHRDATLAPRTTATAFERKGLARGARISEMTFVKLGTAVVCERHTSNAAPITPAESPS